MAMDGMLIIPSQSMAGGICHLLSFSQIQFSQESSTYCLPAGHVLVYPSSSLHRVLPVTSGCRFAFVGWIESYVQAEEDRLLLFNLDAGARGLLSRHGRSEELDLVFQAYANAVRRLSR